MMTDVVVTLTVVAVFGANVSLSALFVGKARHVITAGVLEHAQMEHMKEPCRNVTLSRPRMA